MIKRYGLLTWLVTKYTEMREHRGLSVFGRLVDDPNLFHLNEQSVPRAFAIGLFSAWIPVPFQMFISAAASILLKANVPLSVLLVWITNPLTIPPMFYFAYLVGTWITGEPARNFEFQLTYEWLSLQIGSIGKPLLIGCFVIGSSCALIGYFSMRLFWNKRLSRYMTLRVDRHQRTRRRGLIKKELGHRRNNP